MSHCVFCEIALGTTDRDLVAYRDEHTVVIPCLTQRPQNLGHMLVLPVAHVPFIYDVTPVLAAALMTTVSRVARAVKQSTSADGIVVRQNNERHGGQDVFHVHFHEVPRFENDRFNEGDDRYPFGLVEIARDERLRQAERMRSVLHR
jgi:histidine triad (HIT) family protein